MHIIKPNSFNLTQTQPPSSHQHNISIPSAPDRPHPLCKLHQILNELPNDNQNQHAVTPNPKQNDFMKNFVAAGGGYLAITFAVMFVGACGTFICLRVMRKIREKRARNALPPDDPEVPELQDVPRPPSSLEQHLGTLVVPPVPALPVVSVTSDWTKGLRPKYFTTQQILYNSSRSLSKEGLTTISESMERSSASGSSCQIPSPSHKRSTTKSIPINFSRPLNIQALMARLKNLKQLSSVSSSSASSQGPAPKIRKPDQVVTTVSHHLDLHALEPKRSVFSTVLVRRLSSSSCHDKSPTLNLKEPNDWETQSPASTLSHDETQPPKIKKPKIANIKYEKLRRARGATCLHLRALRSSFRSLQPRIKSVQDEKRKSKRRRVDKLTLVMPEVVEAIFVTRALLSQREKLTSVGKRKLAWLAWPRGRLGRGFKV